MRGKSFRNNPALAFISTQEDTQNDAQEVARENAQQITHDIAQDVIIENAEPSATPTEPRRPYVRTQGRKGHKKPRINLAFDSADFLAEIRNRADREGMSITQLVNEAVAFYLSNTK